MCKNHLGVHESDDDTLQSYRDLMSIYSVYTLLVSFFQMHINHVTFYPAHKLAVSLPMCCEGWSRNMHACRSLCSSPAANWQISPNHKNVKVFSLLFFGGFFCFFKRINLLARRNLLWEFLRLPSSHRAALGLYVILTLWRGRGSNQPPYAHLDLSKCPLLHKSLQPPPWWQLL